MGLDDGLDIRAGKAVGGVSDLEELGFRPSRIEQCHNFSLGIDLEIIAFTQI